jgi:hypothetical protein
MYSRFDFDTGVYGIHKSSPYEKVCDTFADKIKDFYPKYREVILFNDREYANGYQLYNCKFNLFGICDFFELKKMYENNKPMTYEEFHSEYEKEACTEWAKMDEHGVSFGGFWESDDPEIKANAFNLSYETNCRKLYELPFSPKIKLWTVTFGCSRRQESVRWSNFWCEWIKWKIIQMETEIKRVDKKLQTGVFKDILKNISMEPSRIFNWFLDIEEQKSISKNFNTTHYSRPLIDIINELDN